MKTPDLEQVLLASLIQEWGYVVGSAGLRQTLGFASQSALRVAIANGTVPVRVFRIPGRKGPFALAHDLATWLASYGATAGPATSASRPTRRARPRTRTRN